MTNQSIHFASFNGYPIEIIDRHGQEWLTAEQIGKALGLAHPRRAISRIYNRHTDEFTENMVSVTKVVTEAGLREVRIFSLRGAHLIAMFCITDNAKQFRRWALDKIETQTHPTLNTEQLRWLRAELLHSRQTWSDLARYWSMGLNKTEIGRLMGLNRKTVARHLQRMDRCGLLPAPPRMDNAQLALF